jgi:sec-independent protein translocase protein TatA
LGIENPVHLLFIAAVALIVLGPKRLPALARALGQGIREFRASLEEGAEGPPEPEASAGPVAEQPAPGAGAPPPKAG